LRLLLDGGVEGKKGPRNIPERKKNQLKLENLEKKFSKKFMFSVRVKGADL